MAARIKSRVMNREEKAFGAVDMNRMMTAGMGTGLVYALLRLANVGVLLIPGVVFAFCFFLWLTGKQGGVPRYMVFVYTWQAKILIVARRNPGSLAGRLASVLGWEVGAVILNGDLLYTRVVATGADEAMSGIEILETDAVDAGGIEIVTDEELFITFPSE
jgi:hypothetical protein